MAARYQFTREEAIRFAELRTRQDLERAARAAHYQATKHIAKISAAQAVRATTQVSYGKIDQVGIWNRVKMNVQDPFDVRVEATVGESEMKKMARAIQMQGKTKILYQKFLNRCLQLAFRSSFHGNDSTTIGYLRNTPLVYNGYSQIGYASGKLYDSIRIRSVNVDADPIDSYGAFNQTFSFNGPAYESYGKILGTGERKVAPIRILPLMSWVRTKMARGVWRGKDKSRSTKSILGIAIRISQSYSGVLKQGRGSSIKTKKQTGVYSSEASKRDKSIPDWYSWLKNAKARRMFEKYHDRGVTKYYQMLLNDIKLKYIEMYGN